MILSIFVSLLAISPAQAASTSVVCQSADFRWVWTASSSEPALLTRDGQGVSARAELGNERDRTEGEPSDACSLGKVTAPATTIDRYQATILVEGQRIQVRCESIFTMSVSCNASDLSTGLGGFAGEE